MQRAEATIAAQRERDLAGQLDGVVGDRDQQAPGDERTDRRLGVARSRRA